MDIGQIKDLEKKYFDKIHKIIATEEFCEKLLTIESSIRDNYELTKKHWSKKNFIDVAIERLIRYFIYKEMVKVEIKDIYTSPLSSDLAFITSDCVLNIDSKTVNKHKGTNPGDVKWGLVEYNQTSLKRNIPINNHNNDKFKGYVHRGHMPTIDSKTSLPILTYFIKIIYHDNKKKIDEKCKFCDLGDYYLDKTIQLYCVPNGEIIELDYSNDLISGAKTYHYIDDEQSKKHGDEYKPRYEFDGDFCIVQKDKKGFPNRILIETLDNPVNPHMQCIWGWSEKKKKYRVMTGAQTFRINRYKLENRQDSRGNKWNGYIDIHFNR